MIKQLIVTGHPVVTYPGAFVFHKGLTVIKGRNESGKSTILEMIGYAIGGVSQLRRPATDYKNLSVQLDFMVKDKDYRVIRSPKEVVLYRVNGEVLEPLAKATKAVNAAIARILGYRMNVFNMANYCRQAENKLLSRGIEAPERKKMIDQTIGLTAIDQTSAELGEVLTQMNRDINALTNLWTGREPVAPVLDEDLKLLGATVQSLGDAIRYSYGRKSRREVLEAVLATPLVAPTPPVAPVAPVGFLSVSVTQLKAELETLKLAQARRLKVQAVASRGPRALPAKPLEPSLPIQDKGLLEESIKARRDIELAERDLLALRLPTRTLETLQALEADWGLYKRSLEKQKLLAQQQVKCPECQHEFCVAHDELQAYNDVPDTVAKPAVAEIEIMRERDMLPNNDKAYAIVQKIAALQTKVIEHDKETKEAWERHSQALLNYEALVADVTGYNEETRQAGVELMTLEDPAPQIENLNLEIARVSAYQEAYAQYDKQMEAYRRQEADYENRRLERAQQEEELAAMWGIDWYLKDIAKLQDQQARLMTYEGGVTAYTAEKAKFDADMLKLDQLKEQADRHVKARMALADLKVMIKSHLLPSLNRVASNIMTEITLGARSSVQLTDDYEILVDLTPVEAMSGGATTAANLALRLGLGQVLTHGVFSVFMGDELDADLDVDRKRALVQCLQRLTKRVDQVIIVTHTPSEDIEADHWIQL